MQLTVIKCYFKLLKAYLHLGVHLNFKFFLLDLLIARQFLKNN